MAAYIARRLFVMIPTLIGITLLVFLLIALSPGGIGASLRVSGGEMEASKAAQLEAYLEDRYGLDDPVLVQYVRWLGRISPVKFGTRAQISPSGEIIRTPKALDGFFLSKDWFADLELGEEARARLATLPPPGPLLDGEQAVAEHRAASRDYMEARADYIAANQFLEEAVVRYARETGIADAVDAEGEPVEGVLTDHRPETAAPSWAPVQAAALATLEAYEAAVVARNRLQRAFDAKPYPEVGVPVLPGLLSLGPPDFGVAFSRGRPVVDLIAAALPVTILLNLIAIPVIYLVAIPTGMLAAVRRGGWWDIASGALFVALWSVPTVWAGVLAIGYLANEQYLGWFPVSGLHDKAAEDYLFLPTWGENGFAPGYLLDLLWHLVLPVTCLVYAGFAVLAKQTRAAMLDNLSADYVRTARAKGVPARTVILRHVFRNSLLPLITMFVSVFPAMLAGSVVIERIFSIPGMGSLIIEAINLRDRELILANTLMIAFVNLFALLLADILYAFADPRVSYD
jgi:ABC-type dipeptide/oligopeptide/nickel transport system permease component